jgi:acetyl-CoA/propionyl-CoA carboxylase carboxyl transferase subunit
MTIMAPEATSESLDPRDPLLRLRTFFDDNSVELLHERDRSGVLAAAGTVNGVRTIAFCTDGTVMGGAMGVEGCRHIVNAYDTAIEEQSPIVGIWHSGGARLAEGVKALHAVGLMFEAMIRASGYVPQISVVVGRWRGVRPRAHRRRRDGAGRPRVRHRPRHRAQCHR